MVSQLSESYVDGVEATENAIVEQDSETAAVNVKPEIGRTLFIGNLNFGTCDKKENAEEKESTVEGEKYMASTNVIIS
jgi:hypothetical protein